MAKTTGRFLLNIPYLGQVSVSSENIEYILKEISLLFFAWMILKASGRKETEVKDAAIKPKVLMLFMRGLKYKGKKIDPMK